MKKQVIHVNGQDHEVECSSQMPLLWVLRDILKLKGTKFGCGKGLCGACTVHIDGQAVRSCSMEVGELEKERVLTIDSLSKDGEHKLQKAWQKYNVPQCGYCQPGQIMNAAALINENKKPSVSEIREGMSGNICRCGTYQRIEKAIYYAAHGKEL